jgi:hypothetical protein
MAETRQRGSRQKAFRQRQKVGQKLGRFGTLLMATVEDLDI